jgi:hypothetical protein
LVPGEAGGVTTVWKARPTTYKGVAMRSRLEARFAAFLDAEGFEWIYEPRAYAGDGGQYLPDFVLPQTEYPAYVEVKPTLELALAATGRMQVIWESEPNAILLVAVADGPFLIASPTVDGHRWRSFKSRGWSK